MKKPYIVSGPWRTYEEYLDEVAGLIWADDLSVEPKPQS